MRVLMYGWEFPPHISGGLGVACLGMTEALKAVGHEITFVLPRLKTEAPPTTAVRLVDASGYVARFVSWIEETVRSSGASTELVMIDSPLRPYLTDVEYASIVTWFETVGRRRVKAEHGFDLTFTGDYGQNLMEEVARYALIAGAIAAEVPHDVVHVHDWMTMPAGIEARRVSGRPLVVHVHALEFDRSGEHVNQAVYDIERLGMEQADVVVAVSHYTEETIVNRYGIDPAKIRVVHNAVDTRHLRGFPRAPGANGRPRIVLFLGRITFQKGPDYFVEAAAKVLARRDDVHFVMAGAGDMTPRMIERVAELQLGRRIHFTGFLDATAVERIYGMSDIYVMPSVSEPFGLSPLEAMSHEVPVIISRQSGVSEVLTHALKVDFWDIDGMANDILALLDHAPLHDELVVHGSEEIKSIRWTNAAKRLTDIYGEVCSSTRGQAGTGR